MKFLSREYVTMFDVTDIPKVCPADVSNLYMNSHMGAQFELRCDAALSLFEAYQDAVRSETGILKSTHLSHILLCI